MVFAPPNPLRVVDDGTVKTLSERGFGFISGQEGKEYFFHRSGVRGEFHDLAKGHRSSSQSAAG